MTLRTLCWVLLFLSVVPACRQVLGLEHPIIVDDAGAAGAPASIGSAEPDLSVSRGVPPRAGLSCEEAPTSDCGACMQENCESAAQQCLPDQDCRVQLDEYAVCVGSGCDADKKEDCATNLSPTLGTCLGKCADRCEAAVVSPCTLYCACMDQYCADPDDLPADWDCMTTCMALSADIRECRRNHCEWGGTQSEAKDRHMHCKHASDVMHACLTEDELPTNKRSKPCGAGKESTWACDRPSQCCSGKCNDGACE